jgi:two-component system, OmpR family, alkaline phosphatase synthesis response regulator PhoP
MSKQEKILVAEDEKSLRDALKLNLELEGYQVVAVENGVQAVQAFKQEYFNMIILDIMMPEMDGITVCESVRLIDGTIPVLFLSAKGTADDRILGLKKGGDDYIAKPFNLEELLLRIHKLLEKSKQITSRHPVTDVYNFGGNEIDFNAYLATSHLGSRITLTKKETLLLKLLIDNKGEVVTREHILQTAWGYEVYPNTRTIDNFILNFRKYFERDSREPKHFYSVRGVGYRFEA